jgi:hypothetical protein
MAKSDEYGGMSRLLAVFHARVATFFGIANMDYGDGNGVVHSEPTLE